MFMNAAASMEGGIMYKHRVTEMAQKLGSYQISVEKFHFIGRLQCDVQLLIQGLL
jgi:hypothetical protein